MTQCPSDGDTAQCAPVCAHWPWLWSGPALTCPGPRSSVHSCRHAASVAAESSKYSSLELSTKRGTLVHKVKHWWMIWLGKILELVIYFNIMLSENCAKFLTSLVKMFAWYPPLMRKRGTLCGPRPTSVLLSAASPRATPVPCSCSGRTQRQYSACPSCAIDVTI